MGHHHHDHSGHDHGGHHHHHAGKNLSIAFSLNLSFTIIEIVGGFLTNSMAILADAVHDLGDSFSLGLAWYLEKYSNKKRTTDFTYGYRRFSILAAFINSSILIIGSLAILFFAIPRLWDPPMPDAGGMIWLAILGIVVNGAAVLRLKKGESLNEKVVMLHLLEDVIGWAAVLVVGIVLLYFDLPILDPLLSIGLSCYIFWNVFKNFGKTVTIFLQKKPASFDEQTFKEKLIESNLITSVHDIHAWTMDGQYGVLTLHVKVSQFADKEQIVSLKAAIRKIASHSGINHTTIEVEYSDEDCGQPDCM